MIGADARSPALVRIACQSCGERFDVAFSKDRIGYRGGKFVELPPLADSIRDGSLHYGDPPNTGYLTWLVRRADVLAALEGEG